MRASTPVRVLIRIICFTAIALAPAAAWAVEVTNLNDSGAGSLRQAVADTAGGGEVTFQAGLTGTINLATPINLSKSLIISGPGSSVITVKAPSGNRIFDESGGTIFAVKKLTLQGGGGTVASDGGLIRCTVDLVIMYCVLKDGRSSGDGGAVYLSGGELQCPGSTFQNNTSTGGDGGALHMQDSTWFFIGASTFTGNVAYINGGAISLYNVANGDMLGCTVSQNDATTGNGGGLSVFSGDIEIESSTIIGNDALAAHGGGIYASVCDLYIHNGCQITSNTTAGAGGGICSMSGTVRVEMSTLADNVATGSYNGAGGGGIAQISASSGWSLTIDHSTLSGNRATSYLAGGLYTTSDATITDTTFHANESEGHGGGVFYAGEVLVMQRCTYSDNVSGGNGGGLNLPNVSSFAIQLEQCTFWHNQADDTGGGIETGRTLYLYACTLTENVAGYDINSSGDGGGVHATSFGYVMAQGSIIARNHDYAGSGTQYNDCMSLGGASGSYSLLGVDVGCSGIVNGVNGNLVGTEVSPVYPYLSDLDDHGGPTKTCLLLANSPARNTNIACLGRGSIVLTGDQRGRPRPRGAACDMGSVEVAGGNGGLDLLLFESY